MSVEKTLLALWRHNENSFELKRNEIERLGQALFSLQRGLTGQRRLAGAGYMQNADSLGAYLLYYFPVTYAQIKAILQASQVDCWDKDTISILDVGSGPGPASAAFVDEALKKGVKEEKITLTLLDSSAKALNLAQSFFKREHPLLRVKTQCVNLETFDFSTLTSNFDAVLASHVFNELWKDDAGAAESRSRVLETLARKLTPSGVVLLSEPALLQTSRDLISLVMQVAKKGFAVAAPCPGAINQSFTCPLFASDTVRSTTCHATVYDDFPSFVEKIAAAAGLKREAVKMTYFLLTLPKTRNASDTSYRVVSDAMLNKSGRIRYLLCDGVKRTAFSAKEGDKAAARENFFTLMRYDAVELTHPEIRGEKDNPSFGFKDDTKIAIVRFTKKGHQKTTLLKAKSQERKGR